MKEENKFYVVSQKQKKKMFSSYSTVSCGEVAERQKGYLELIGDLHTRNFTIGVS